LLVTDGRSPPAAHLNLLPPEQKIMKAQTAAPGREVVLASPSK
jgi:hypothetical protein